MRSQSKCMHNNYLFTHASKYSCFKMSSFKISGDGVESVKAYSLPAIAQAYVQGGGHDGAESGDYILNQNPQAASWDCD